MDKQKPVTEEVKNWSIDFMKSVETEGRKYGWKIK